MARRGTPSDPAQQVPRLLLGEAQYLVEPGLQTDVRADVEAAGDVVHRDRRHAGDEEALESAVAAPRPALQRGEEVPVEAAAVGEGPIRVRAAMHKHRVGEVVVLVDEHVERNAAIAGVQEQLVELGLNGGGREDAPRSLVGEQIPIPLQCVAQHRVAVGLEALPQGLQGVVEHREVEAQGDVAMAVLRGAPADVSAREDGLERLGAVAVVVVLQQRHPTGLAEAAGTNQKDVAFFLQVVEKTGLVHVEAALQPDGLEVGQPYGMRG